MKVDVTPQAGAFPARLERRDPTRPRVLGYLVSLNGLHGVIACQMTAEATVEHWSVGNLISVVHESSRLVGVVCELMTSDQRWNSQGVNLTLVKIELSGEVIDEAAMADMLAAGELGGAGLDVYEHEPVVNPKLLRLPNVVLLPHMSSATIEGRIDMGEKVMINIQTFLDGHRPPDRVIPSMM